MPVNEQIKAFIVKELMHDDGRTLRDDESLLERAILDSLGLLQVIAFLEKEYNLTIQDVDIIPENFESVDAISKFVARSRNGVGAG